MKYLSMIPLLALLALAVVPSAAAQTSTAPMMLVSNSLSLNWSGYAVSTSDVTSATGTFTVPTVGAPGSVGGLPTDVSVWVGIDGYSSGTVEQTGVSGSFNSATNAPTYYAWWEMYPRSSTTIRSMTVSPGDSITASVDYNGGGSFTLAMTDNTDSQSFTTTVNAPVGGLDAAQRSSAEWVVERAATIYKGYLTILPLATFGSTAFSAASFTSNGVTDTLQHAVDSYPQVTDPANPPPQPYWDQITMVSVDTTTSPPTITPLVTVSSVSSNSFTVGFLANGAPFPIVGVYRH